MTRIRREQYPGTKHWPAGTDYFATGRYIHGGRAFTTTGMGRTAAKARLDLLWQMGRRRFPPRP